MPLNNKEASESIIRSYKQRAEEYWVSLSRKNTLTLFRDMVKKVPAYVKFLKENNFDIDKIVNHEDLKLVPTTSKKTYFQKFPISELVWQNDFKKTPFVFTSTSGSTGEPTYFVRDETLDWQYSVLAQMFMDN